MSICISHATSTDRLPAALLKDLCPIKIGILVKSIFFIIPIKNKRWSISTYVCCAIKFVPVLRIFHSPWHFKPVSPLEHKLLVAVATGPFRLRRLTCGASPTSLTRGHTYCQGWTHIAASSSPKARSSGFTRVGVHTPCCTFCGFGQRYYRHPSLRYTEYFHCPEKPFILLLHTLDNHWSFHCLHNFSFFKTWCSWNYIMCSLFKIA